MLSKITLFPRFDTGALSVPSLLMFSPPVTLRMIPICFELAEFFVYDEAKPPLPAIVAL